MKPSMRLLARLLAVFLTGVPLAACDRSDDSVAGGSAVEGETVTARILDAHGAPFAGTRVHAVVDTPSTWALELVADSTGSVSIPVPAEARVLVLTLDSPSESGRILTFRIPLRRDLDTTLVLERWGSLSGTATPPAGWSSRAVLCPGLGVRSGTVRDSFVIAHLPPGSWPFLLEADSAGRLDTFDLGDATMPTGGADLRVAFAPRTRAAIASFDDTARTPPTCAVADADDVPDASRLCSSWTVGTASWSGSSLRVHLAGTDAHPASLLLRATDATTPILVRATDTLALMIRGSGFVRIAFDPALGSGDSVVVPATWTRLRIPATRLLPTGIASAGIQGLSIASPEDSWIVLDEIAIDPAR